MPQLQVADKQVFYTIKQGIGKHGYLKLKPGFQLDVILPKQSSFNVEEILNKKCEWLKRGVEELSQLKKIFQEERTLLKGHYLLLKTILVKKTKKGIRVFKNIIHIYEDGKYKKEEVLKNYMAGETQKYIQKKIGRFTKRLRVKANSIFIKDMKIWSHCSKDGNLAFNWKLIALPEELIDYIIAHEVAHLKYFNHSKQFKRALSSLCIDYKRKEKLIKMFQ